MSQRSSLVMKDVKNRVPPSRVGGARLRSRTLGKLVSQPSIFCILFTRLPPPVLNPTVNVAPPSRLTLAVGAQLVQITTFETSLRLCCSMVWSVHSPVIIQSFTPKNC